MGETYISSSVRDRIYGLFLATVLMVLGITVGAYVTWLGTPKAAPAPAPKPTEWEYTVYHTGPDGQAAKNSITANAVDVHGFCIMFYKDFHVVGVLCPGSNEVVVLDSNLP